MEMEKLLNFCDCLSMVGCSILNALVSHILGGKKARVGKRIEESRELSERGRNDGGIRETEKGKREWLLFLAKAIYVPC